MVEIVDNPVLNGLIEQALAADIDLRVAEANLLRSDALLAEERTGREVGVGDLETSWAQFAPEFAVSSIRIGHAALSYRGAPLTVGRIACDAPVRAGREALDTRSR
jgi:hypothetical protein